MTKTEHTRPAAAKTARRPAELSLDTTPRKTPTGTHGSDPYNTSGTFDRKKNWSRVGKR